MEVFPQRVRGYGGRVRAGVRHAVPGRHRPAAAGEPGRSADHRRAGGGQSGRQTRQAAEPAVRRRTVADRVGVAVRHLHRATEPVLCDGRGGGRVGRREPDPAAQRVSSSCVRTPSSSSSPISSVRCRSPTRCTASTMRADGVTAVVSQKLKRAGLAQGERAGRGVSAPGRPWASMMGSCGIGNASLSTLSSVHSEDQRVAVAGGPTGRAYPAAPIRTG